MLKKVKKSTFLFIAARILHLMGFFFQIPVELLKTEPAKNPQVQNAIFRATAINFVTTVHDEKGRNFNLPKTSIFDFVELVAPR